MKITFRCKFCGGAFVPWTGNKSIYCSQACYKADPFTPSVVRRFWAKVFKTSGCWLYTQSQDGNGYGHCGRGGSGAHRFSWQLHYGSIANGLGVLHKCDNPPCVRPDHLFLGTTAANSADMVAKGRSLKGVKHPMVVVSESIVREIRATYVPRKNGGLVAISKRFGVAPSTVHAIVTRKIWKHI